MNDAFSMIDEAHSTGVLGATGRGIAEHFGCEHPDILMGTLSKALGSEGGFVCARREIVELIVNKARSFIFSTAPGAPAVAAADAALSVLESEPWRVDALRRNVSLFTDELARLGIAAKSETAIVPVIIGDERKAMDISSKLLEKGFLIPAIRYPTVARGVARLRCAIMSAHSEDQLRAAASAIATECH